MSDDKKEEKNLFDEYGLQAAWADADSIKIGETYPIYGMITNIEKYEPDDFRVTINYNIHGKVFCQDPSKLEIVKERAFESAIFITKIEDIRDGNFYGTIQTIVFGKKQVTSVC